MTAQTNASTLPMPARASTLAASIGVLDVDGLHLPERPVVPITGAIRHVGDLYAGARRHGLTQLWLTDAWVRAAALPGTLAVAGQFRELRHAFVTDGLDALHAFPAALTPWLDLRKKGEAGSGVSLVFPLYDEHAVWGLDTDGATLLGALVAYAAAVGAPYYRSPGRTGVDLLQELGKRGAGSQREYPERLPAPAGQADTVTELSWLRTMSPVERGKAYLHSYDKNAQWLSAAGVVELGLSGIEERRDPTGKLPFDKKLPGYWLARIYDGEERWYCTPTLTLAHERGRAVAISQAHVWTEHSRALESWYERLRGARTALQGDATPAGRLALGALKLTYSLTVSSFNGAWLRDKCSPLYRPDWRHAVISQANANMTRALHKMEGAGYKAVAVHKDAVYLVSDEVDPVVACPPSITLGSGLGHFKVQDAVIPVETVLSAFDGTRGGIGTLLKLLKPLRERSDTAADQGAA
jgi:hypothetical protein